MKKTKIIIIAANPKDTSQLRIDKEVREIEEALRRSRHRDKFEIKAKWAQRSTDLRRALLDEQPHILHFSGHGDHEGLALEDDTGKAVIVPAQALADLFKHFRDTLECVLLNACYSAVQATAIAKSIPYVISMTEEITDDAALEFAVGFYDALGAGKSIEQAFEFGHNAVDLLGRSNRPNPIILSKTSNKFAVGHEGFKQLRILRASDEEHAYLSLVSTGAELFSITAGCMAAEHQNDELNNAEEVGLVGNFLQDVDDWSNIFVEIEIVQRLKAEFDITESLTRLANAGFVVYAGRLARTIQFGQERHPWAVAVIRVLRIANHAWLHNDLVLTHLLNRH